ncbi:MAG: T9SS type A sorting domain-containing protein, partial [Bacteroidota bacterium]
AFFTAMNGPVEDGGSGFGAIRKSVDGREWATVGRLPADERGFVAHLAAGGNGSLWAVMGGLDNVPQGEVWRSVDGGVTWASVGAFDGEALVGNRLIARDVVIGPEGRVWVGFSQGVGGTGFKGLLVRTVEPVAASAGEEVPGTPSEVVLGTPYPNPTQDAVTVPLVLAEPAEVRVMVYDLLGREVAVLADGAQAAGTHVLVIETAVWPAGAYLIRATVDGATETRRVTVSR